MIDKRYDAIILGRNIGTHTGWDELETNTFVLYDFVPRGINIPAGDLTIRYDEGKFHVHDNEGDLIFEFDILATMLTLERV